MLTCPTRAVPVLAPIDSPTVPFADPLCPETIEIQPALAPDVHAQPDSVVTSTDSLPPAAPIESTGRLRAKWQGGGA
jgi:hypothetical protein